MPITELIASMKGVRDVRQGLQAIEGAAASSAQKMARITSFVSGVNSSLSAVTATLVAVEGLTGAVGEETLETVREAQRLVSIVQQASEGLELLPAAAQRAVLSALPVVGAAAAGVAVAAGPAALALAQIKSFEERFAKADRRLALVEVFVGDAKRAEADRRRREARENAAKELGAAAYVERTLLGLDDPLPFARDPIIPSGEGDGNFTPEQLSALEGDIQRRIAADEAQAVAGGGD